MRRLVPVLLAAAVLAFIPARADEVSTTGGNEDPAARSGAAVARHLQILTDLQAELPASSHADLGPAIQASMKAQRRLTAALETSQTQPSVTGLQRARQNVAANLERSTANLERVIAKVPPQAAEKIQAALARIQEQRAAVLANLDRVIAMQSADRTERAARGGADRLGAPEHPQHPDHPDHPDHPSRPERPEHPDHP